MKGSRTALFTVFLAALIFVAGSKTAFAYLDPGTLNMALQVVVGVVIGGLVAIKFYWHKVLGFLGRKSQKPDSNKPDQNRAKN